MSFSFSITYKYTITQYLFLFQKVNDMIKNIMVACAHTVYIYHCRSHIFLTEYLYNILYFTI